MTAQRLLIVLPLLTVLAACAAPAQETAMSVLTVPPGGPDALYTPDRVVPGRLEYAPDRSTFAPILTERAPYPTQLEANDAYLRLMAGGPSGRTYPSTVRLFGCKPGALDGQTARVTRYRGPVVHCATDFLDGSGMRLWREPANFYYHSKLWSMQPVYPPRTPVAWRNREASPKDFWSWVPGRGRYQ